jgi:hypothetical protein
VIKKLAAVAFTLYTPLLLTMKPNSGSFPVEISTQITLSGQQKDFALEASNPVTVGEAVTTIEDLAQLRKRVFASSNNGPWLEKMPHEILGLNDKIKIEIYLRNTQSEE